MSANHAESRKNCTADKKESHMTAKVLFTGKTHTTDGRSGAAHSSDGFLDIKLPQPHPAAENLFGAAWSACYMGALELAASKKNIKLPPEVAVDAEINLNGEGGNFFLASKLNVSLPGLDREVAEALIHDAHGICPYSKAVHGNIAVETKLV
jgi:Ohr subfamily peroxiredoxin